MPRANVGDSADISDSDADYFFVATKSYKEDTITLLKNKGISDDKILTEERLSEIILSFTYSSEILNRVVEKVTSIVGTAQFLLISENYDSPLVLRLKETLLASQIKAVADLQDTGVHRRATDKFNLKFIQADTLPNVPYAIVLTTPARYAEVLQRVSKYQLDYDLIFPFANNDGLAQLQTSSTPCAMFSFPHAGHGRFYPVINSLGGKLNRNEKPWTTGLHENKKYAREKRNASVEELLKDTENCMLAQLTSLDYYQHTVTHEIYDVRNQGDYANKSVKIVQLIRDPRDLLTSVAMRLDPDDFENVCRKAISGFHYFRNTEKLLYWPDIASICDMFLFVKKSSNGYIVRFEDLGVDSLETYKSLIDWLGWDNKLNPKLSDQDYLDSIYLGTFEFQTKNKLSRGNIDNKMIGCCRKGIVGDWRNLWSDTLKELFKEKCGQQLIELGYETDEQW